MIVLSNARDLQVYSETLLSDLLEIKRFVLKKHLHKGYCHYCASIQSFKLISRPEWTNLRNNFFCDSCGLSSRQRFFFSVLENLNISLTDKAVIFEKVTPFFQRLHKKYPKILGCEYLGDTNISGELYTFNEESIQHENLLSMSFEDNSLDFLFHQDVLEHVPDAHTALVETLRVLKPGGSSIFMAPFFHNLLTSRKRARLEGDKIVNILPPSYHGNPVNKDEGALVFEDFGLDFVDSVEGIGFKVELLIDHSIVSYHFTDHHPDTTFISLPIAFKLSKY